MAYWPSCSTRMTGASGIFPLRLARIVMMTIRRPVSMNVGPSESPERS